MKTMKEKSLVEMINSIDTSYLTEQERTEAIARAQASEYAAELVYSAFAWIKNKLANVRASHNLTKHSHA